LFGFLGDLGIFGERDREGEFRRDEEERLLTLPPVLVVGDFVVLLDVRY